MKLHFQSTGNTEGFRAGKPLDMKSIRMAVNLVPVEPENVKYLEQKDGSIILEILQTSGDIRDRILKAANSICGSWGDMKFEEIE